MSKRKKRNRKEEIDLEKTCYGCANCMYVGEGDSVCDVNMEVVLDTWDPAEEFYWCGGKRYIAE